MELECAMLMFDMLGMKKAKIPELGNDITGLDNIGASEYNAELLHHALKTIKELEVKLVACEKEKEYIDQLALELQDTCNKQTRLITDFIKGKR